MDFFQVIFSTSYSIKLIIIFTIFSCANPEDEVVAKINDISITKSSFETKYSDFLKANYKKDNLLNRYAFLNGLIDNILILNFASKEKIKESSEFIIKRNKIFDQLMLNYFFEEEVNLAYGITDSELRKFSVWKNNTFHVRHLFAKNKYQIENMHMRLLSGDSWEDIAQQTFKDTILKNNGGDLGWVSLGDLDPIFELTAFTLEKKQISGPIKTKSGYSIIQLLDKVPNGLITEQHYQLSKNKLKNLVQYYKRQLGIQEYMIEAEKSLNIKFSDDVLHNFYNNYFSLTKTKEFDETTVLVKVNKDVWDIRKTKKQLQSLSDIQESSIITKIDFKNAIKGLICRSHFLEKAKLKNINKDKLFEKEFQELINKALVKNVLDMVYGKLEQNDSEYLVRKKDKYLNFRNILVMNNVVSVDSSALKNLIIS